ncbi:MAG: dethiobiotin synthase [Cycloclasticus sp.]|nr:dethiobiotin synthase [Cycloclasticus sp.]MBG96697.1 dethiobiotin synthase [Cycloclasticus sp.]HAI96542.1 dethiobiotin synthase [Methylococcaceae bacterium]|tara:strand:+ start:852 stop:1550 length:699 start_codon:yes stop_codon:yes gene_type:complete
MPKNFFITGTDTDVGKTYVAAELVKAFQAGQIKASGFKPVAAGAKRVDGQFKNDDALELMCESSQEFSYKDINPYCFEPPIAPHIAADQAGVVIDISVIKSCYAKHQLVSDVVIIEGAGGWKVPLNSKMGFDDLALSLDAAVIIVVGLKLGCINHALLTEEAVLNKGCQVAGWIGNDLSGDFDEVNENLEALKGRMKSKFLGAFEYRPDTKEKSLLEQRKIESVLDYLVNFR